MIKQIGFAVAALTAVISFTSPAMADPPWARHRGWDHRRAEHHRYDERRWSHERWRHERGYQRYGYYAPPPRPGIYIPFR